MRRDTNLYNFYIFKNTQNEPENEPESEPEMAQPAGDDTRGIVDANAIYSDVVVPEIDMPGATTSATLQAKADEVKKLKAAVKFWRDAERLSRFHMQDVLITGTTQERAQALNQEAKEKLQRTKQELEEAERELQALEERRGIEERAGQATAGTQRDQDIDPPGYYLPRMEDFYWGTGPGPRPGSG